MTGKQIEAARRTLPPPPWKNWTDAERTLYEELSCREMVNSCLCYGGIEDFWAHHDWCSEGSYAARHVRALGRARVEEICKEQAEDMARARILRNVHTDSEGLSYNSIVWADD